jgi:N-methylhydantoinase B
MISNLQLRAGDILATQSPCGGGYGEAVSRDPALVLKDVLNGFVNVAAARSEYGVVIEGACVDEQDTSRVRTEMRRVESH